MARVALAIVNAQAELVRVALNNGYLRFYAAPRPADTENSVGSAVLLAECRIAAVSSPAPTTGELTVTVAEEDATLASGIVGWARALQSNGTTVVCDYSVGLVGSTADIIVAPSASIAINKRFAVSQYVHRMIRGS
jgi:hypothetical protein